MRVVSVKVGEAAKIEEIDNSLAAMQKYVGGLVEFLTIGEREVLVCNEEGKIKGLPLNRPLISEGRVADIIAGDFLICYCPEDSDDFADMPKDIAEKYVAMFSMPVHIDIAPVECYSFDCF